MNRYILRFTKEGEMRYIAHLDVQRLFQRLFRRIGVKPAYTKGFHPKPRMYIAQPLSLGFESKAEYLEVQTDERYDAANMLAKANASLPEGIHIEALVHVAQAGKTLPALAAYASYAIELPLCGSTVSPQHFEAFLQQENITVQRWSKRKKKHLPLDVKHMVRSFSFDAVTSDTLKIHALLRASGSESLNPLLILESFCAFLGIPYCKEHVYVRRLEMYGERNGALCPLLSCFEDDGSERKVTGR